ncbi:MAG: GNAT family N-acetyltransferase [Caulobacteraceae bacterium]
MTTHPYATAEYARSLPHVGEPLAIPEWGTHLLVRPTQQAHRLDATGSYPLAVVSNDADLEAGLERMKAAKLVSVVLVFDDRLRPDGRSVSAAFDLARPFKSHFLYDRSLGPLALGKHHRYELRRALARVEVAEFVLGEHLQAWASLYAQLAARHGFTGLHALPAAHHQALAALPGLRAFGAFIEGRLVSAHLFVAHEGYAISHLAASAAEGYQAGAAYAVNDLAVSTLIECGVINFGGGAGPGEDPTDGLVRFKKGFSNRTASSWLCGKVLDREGYETLSAGYGENGFFPVYRGARAQEPADADQG